VSKKVFVTSVQPDPDGPVFGRVMDPVAIQRLQDYAHGHINQVVRDLLMAGAPAAEIAGLAATVAGGLSVSIATGSVVDALGVSYETPDDASVVTMAAAHVSLPRIDLIYATLEVDANAETELVSFRQLRTQAELEADTDPYVPTQFSQPTELHTRATIGVKTGVANASPAAPAVGAGEVALWRVHVAAGQTVLSGGDLTSVRVLLKSLYAVIQDVLALQGQMAGLTESVQDIVGAFLASGDGSLTLAYNDVANTYSLVLAAGYKALLDGATAANTTTTLVKRDGNGSFAAGPLKLAPVSAPVGGGSQPGVAAVGDVGTGVETVVASFASAPGTPSVKLSVKHISGQNCHQFRLYNTRGGAAGSDRLRYLNDEFGRTYILGEVHVLVDAEGLGGSLDVASTLTAGSKSFEIDHPADPLNKNIRFATTESPNHGIEMWGEAVLVAGAKVVDLDDAMNCSAGTFEALFGDCLVFLQNRTGYSALKYTLAGSSLTINCESGASTDTVNWQIKGRRIDELVKALPNADGDGVLIVEYDKPEAADDPGPTTIVGRAEEAVPDEIVEVVDFSRIGTVGFPRHAALAPALGPVPTREVTFETHDLDNNPYEP
jgi:hypothetical protein